MQPRARLDVPAARLILPPDAPAEQWHAARAGGICGSDLAGILGCSPFTTAARVYLDKLGHRREIGGKPFDCPIFWGTMLEDAVATAWTHVTEIDVWRTGTYAHRERDWQRANPDRLGDGFGLEIKTTDGRNAAAWEVTPTNPAGMPFHVLCQVQHYMAVTGLPYFWVICLIGGNQLVVRRVEADPEDHAVIIETESEFWHEYVLARRAPLVVPADADTMKALYRAQPRAALDLPESTVRKVARHAAAKEQMSFLDDEITALEVDIKAALGIHEIGRFRGREAVTWKGIKRHDKNGDQVRVFKNVFGDWAEYVGRDPDLDGPDPTDHDNDTDWT